MERYVHSFGGSLAVAALLTALVFAVKAIFPEFEEWGEEAFGHAWLYMGILGLAVFVGLGLLPLRWTSTGSGLAGLLAGSVIVSGAVILAAAALLATYGSFG